MSTALLPQSFWFRLSFASPRIEAIPRSGSRGKLLDLPPACTLAAPGVWEGREPFAEIRTAWNARGLGIAVTVAGKAGSMRLDPNDPEYRDAVHIWIDTRDTRDIHRATRHCHRFSALLQSSPGESLTAEVIQKPIARAMADAPKARAEAIHRRAERLARGWRLELFFEAEALNGFDPETNRRLGLMVSVVEPSQGEQNLGVGREFPIESDPSLWATLELTDGPA